MSTKKVIYSSIGSLSFLLLLLLLSAGKEFAASLVTMNRRQKVWIQKNGPLHMDDAIFETTLAMLETRLAVQACTSLVDWLDGCLAAVYVCSEQCWAEFSVSLRPEATAVFNPVLKHGILKQKNSKSLVSCVINFLSCTASLWNWLDGWLNTLYMC